MAGTVARGDLWMYRFAPPDKRRPVLVLSRQAALTHLRTAVVAPVTRSIRGLDSEVPVGVEDGLKAPSVVNLDHLFTVPRQELRQYLGHLDDARMEAVCEALAVALGCR